MRGTCAKALAAVVAALAPALGTAEAALEAWPDAVRPLEAETAGAAPAQDAVRAPEPPGSHELPAARAEGPFLGDRYRWAEMPILKRVAFDVVAIPANVPSWSFGDYGQLALWTGAGVALSTGASPTADVRIDRWFRQRTGRGPVVWTGAMQGSLWGVVAVGGLGTWSWAAASGREDVAQGLSLMGEALAVTQVYHVTTKVLIGRSGPSDGDGLGEFGGPANALRVYPAGTPSGHAATLYSLLSAGTAYFGPPLWAEIALHAAVGGVVFFHVVDHRHFASESLWGSALGWYTGQWVVKHRASYRFAGGRRERQVVEVVPVLAGGAPGLGIAARF